MSLLRASLLTVNASRIPTPGKQEDVLVMCTYVDAASKCSLPALQSHRT